MINVKRVEIHSRKGYLGSRKKFLNKGTPFVTNIRVRTRETQITTGIL